MKLYYIYTFKLTFILLILISTTISCTFFNKSSTENEYSTDQYTFTNSVVIPLENRPILKISTPGIAIESISFDVILPDNISFTIGSLSNIGNTQPPDENIYQYILINHSKSNSRHYLSNIHFAVEHNWISDSNQNIVLQHFSGKWNKLPTLNVDSNKTHAIYKSSTNQFGLFAITLNKTNTIKKPLDSSEKTSLSSSITSKKKNDIAESTQKKYSEKELSTKNITTNLPLSSPTTLPSNILPQVIPTTQISTNTNATVSKNNILNQSKTTSIPTITPTTTPTPIRTIKTTPSPTPTPIVAQTAVTTATAVAQANRPTPQPTRTPIPTPARPTPPTCLVWTNENPLSFTSSNNTLGITFNPSNGSNVYKNPDSDNLILLTIKFPYKVSLLKATLINSDQIGIDIKNSFMSSDQIIFSTIQTVEIGKKYNLFISARHPSGNIIGPVNSSFDVMLPATEIPIKPGWNLISMPILPEDNDLNNVLQNSYVSKIMTTDPNNSQWKNTDVLPCTPEKHLQDIKELSNLSTPQGYWFFTSRPETIVIKHNETISYNSINAHLSNLKEGWNLINVISSEKIGTFVKADEYLQTVTWTEGYGYDKTSKLYYSFKPNTNSSLEVGYGYYIKIIKNNTD